MTSSSIRLGLRSQFFLLRSMAILWLSRAKTVLWTLLVRRSTTPILAWAALKTSIPLSIIAHMTITMTLHRYRRSGSNVVRR